MAIVVCLWCDTSLKPKAVLCPECGFARPVDEPKVVARGTSSAAVRRGRWFVLPLLAAPLMLSAAYASHLEGLPTAMAGASGPVVTAMTDPSQPPAVYADPVQRSVWVDGVKAVQQAVEQPSYTNFAGSYVNVAAGNVVSFCGEVAGTSGYDSASGGRRFISIFGQTQSTMLENDDPSFSVLWTRVCEQDESPA